MMNNQTKIKKGRGAITFKAATQFVLISILVVSLMLASYSWIRNYFDLKGAGVTTGKMLYSCEAYAYDSETKEYKPIGNKYDTGTTPNKTQDNFEFAGGATIDLSEGTAENPKYDEIVYVVKKYAASIDIDVSLLFSIEQFEAKNSFLGAVKYQISTQYVGSFDPTTYFANGIGENSGTPKAVTSAWKEYTGATITGSLDNYAIIRVKFSQTETTQAENQEFTVHTRLGVSQKGAPQEGTASSGTTISIKNRTELESAIANYRENDILEISQSLEYVGDLVFVKPCRVVVKDGATLTVYGNMLFSYKYDGEFAIDTSQSGQIVLAKQEVRTEGAGGTISTTTIGGNLYIDTPLSYFYLRGYNSTDAGKRDMYIEGEISVQASVVSGLNEDEAPTDKNYGVTFNRISIGGAQLKVTENTLADGTVQRISSVTKKDDVIKDVTVSGETRVYVESQTQIGKLTADDGCSRIIIVNRGTIAGIDLSKMPLSVSFVHVDNIYINNYGTLTDKWVLLPWWSYKYEGPGYANPNTRIIATSGLDTVWAVISTHVGSKETTPEDKYFYSYGSNTAEEKHADDIEYIGRDTLVEKNESGTGITVHYEKITDETLTVIGGGQYTKPGENGENEESNISANTLQVIIEYYAYGDVEEYKIEDLSALASVKIICYGEMSLTEADYAFLRTLESVEFIDLSEAWSVDFKVPDSAFAGLTNLADIAMSEYDKVWGNTLFTGTALVEIRFPTSLETVVMKDNAGNGSFAGIKFVHTSTKWVNGLYTERMDNWGDSDDRITYYFVPASAYETYVLKFGNTDFTNYDVCMRWRRYIFTEVAGMGIYGDYVLKLNSDYTCEFITYAKNTRLDPVAARTGEYTFDFATITVDGQKYEISSYADLAMFEKISTSNSGTAVTFSEKLTHIGERAFYRNNNSTGYLGDVTFPGTGSLEVEAYAFRTTMTGTLSAPNLTELTGSYSFSEAKMTSIDMPKLDRISSSQCFYNCGSLTRAEFAALTTIDGDETFNRCGNLVTLLMPNLREVLNCWTMIYHNSNALRYVEIGVIPYLESTNNRNLIYASAHTVVVVCGTDAGGVADAWATSDRHLVVDAAISSSYPGYSNDIAITDFDKANLKWASCDVNSINATETTDISNAAFCFYDNGDGTAKLIAYTGSDTLAVTDSYTMPSTFKTADGSELKITSIEHYAYRNISMTVPGTLMVSEHATYIGKAAFYGKTIYKLDLANVKTVDYNAFRSSPLYYVYGTEVEEIHWETFRDCSNLAIVYMPKLHTDIASPDGNGNRYNIFYNCNDLRFVYTAASYDIKIGHKANVWLVNCEFLEAGENVRSTEINVILQADKDTELKYQDMFSSKDLASYGGENFEDVMFADWYDYTVTVGGMEHTMHLPGYVFVPDPDSENGNVDKTLTNVGKDTVSRYVDDTGTYTMPSHIYPMVDGEDKAETATIGDLTFNKYIVVGDGTSEYRVNAMKPQAFRNADVACINFTFGKYIKYVPAHMFRYESNISKVTGTMDLNNVEEVGTYCFQYAKFSELKAPNLKIIRSSAFREMPNLKAVDLPKIETLEGSGFYLCTALETAIIGPSCTSMGNEPFNGSTMMTQITIQSENKVLKPGTNNSWLGTSEDAKKQQRENLTILVPASQLAGYTATTKTYEYTDEDGNKLSYEGVAYVHVDHYTDFGNATVQGDMYIYWSVLADGNAAITAIGGTVVTDENGQLTLPSTLETYPVVKVTGAAISALAGVQTLELPEGLTTLDFSADNLPASVSALVIAHDNKHFMTTDGVLYSKDGTMLLLYPTGKTGSTFAVGADVTYIADGAFRNAQYLENLTIAGKVDIAGNAFYGAKVLADITFDGAEASRFLGRNNFSGTSVKIYVPSGLVDDFKANVIFDSSVRDMITAKPAAATEPTE